MNLRNLIAARLRERRQEIEEAALERVNAIDGTADGRDPEYVEGLRAAVTAALDYGIASVELGEERSPPIPPILVSQARLAACSGVPLDTVLRRYFAGFTLLGEYVIEEAEAATEHSTGELHPLLGGHNSQFDELVATVSQEYARERDSWLRSSQRRLTERVEKLLAAASVDRTPLDYDLEGWHVGLVLSAGGSTDPLQHLASRLNRRLLLVRRRDGSLWAWLGAPRSFDPEEIEELTRPLPESALGVGEPGIGFRGWRTTHRQAKASMAVATRGQMAVARYSEVALLASALQDRLLVGSLCELYLNPLTEGRDGGGVLRETLRAYLSAERNVSSTAAALGVSRTTVTNRLHSIESRLGRSIRSCALGLELALQLEALLQVGNVSGYFSVPGSD